MLRNYLTVALRNLHRQRGYTLLNVTGLAAGLACCLLILLFVRDERSYDRFHERSGRIGRAVLNLQSPAGTRPLATTPAALATNLVPAFPEVERAVRLFRPASTTVAHADRRFQEASFFFADSSLFDVFSFPLRAGDPQTALQAPFSVVLTEATARRYFGEADPMGTLLTVNDTLRFEVTGIVADPPVQSHLHFDFVASMGSWEAMAPSLVDQWAPHMYYTYLLLSPQADPAALEAALPAFVERSVNLSEGWGFDFRLQRLTDIHLHSEREGEVQANGRAAYLYLFGAIALFILLIACVNFMNLATAQAARRRREVGMRKVLGALRGQLAGQFLGEAVLLSALALVLAVAVVSISLPAFNALTGKDLTVDVLAQGPFLLGLPALALGVGLLAGSYPAFYLSGFRPLAVLKEALPSGVPSGGRRLRAGLVVFQFAVTVCLIAGTAVVYDQLHYMRSQDLGFSPEQMVVVSSLTADRTAQATAFQAEALQQTAVRGATLSNTVPGRPPFGLSVQGEGVPEDVWQVMNTLFADPAFVETYSIRLVAGRDFSAEMATDTSSSFLLNEAAAARLGWTPEEAVGKRFALRRGGGQVVGVVEDFHYASLQQAVEPLAIVATPVAYGSAPLYVSLRLGADDLPGTLAALEAAWAARIPDRPFDYFFLDADFDRQYRSEERLVRIVGTFAGMAILIACLGLFGLASFVTERRTKEIGVRKVLGATVPGLVGLLSKDFLKPVGLAFVVATPLAYLALDRWLDGFAYRTDLGAGVFVLAGMLALAVAWLTVGYRAVRAALIDPAQSLRYE